jgi:glycosyltransferase involved in cell wall biosynthesis
VQPVVFFFPARDEAESVGDVVRRVPARACGHDVVPIVIDDGSRDATAHEARVAGAYVVQLRGCGLGAAVRAGLRAALDLDPAAVAFCDADGEYAPEELGQLVEPILEGRADYVVGSRFAGDIKRMLVRRRIGNRVLTAALARLTSVAVTDGQSGYRALSPIAARAARIIHDYNYAQVLTLDLVAKDMRYAEVPITYSFRERGTSFVKLPTYLRHVVPAVWRQLRTQPSVFDDVAREPLPSLRPDLGVDRAS